MKARTVYGVMVSVMLLLLTTLPGFAQPPQPPELLVLTNMSLNSVANTKWINIEVDTPGNTGQYTSVAINPANGGTYVSYYDATTMTLRMAMNRGFGTGNCGPDNDWLCQTVDSGADFGKYSSIAVNPVNGEIGIAYYDASHGKLKFAHATLCTTCAWSIDSIDEAPLFPLDNSGQYASLKYDVSGIAYIAYYYENTGDTAGADALKIAYYVGINGNGNCGYGSIAGHWQCDTIQTGEGVGQYASLTVDKVGERHIAYYDEGDGDLWYATSLGNNNCGPGNSWLCYPVTGSTTDVGQYASLYVDTDINFHIAYYDATADALKYAVKVPGSGNCGVLGSAQCDEIDAMMTGYHPLGISITEDAAGYPVIAYQSQFGDLNVARPLDALGMPFGSGNCGPQYLLYYTWHCETLLRRPKFISGARHADYVSIATDASGLSTIAYHEFITPSDGGNLGISFQRPHIFMPFVVRNP